VDGGVRGRTRGKTAVDIEGKEGRDRDQQLLSNDMVVRGTKIRNDLASARAPLEKGKSI